MPRVNEVGTGDLRIPLDLTLQRRHSSLGAGGDERSLPGLWWSALVKNFCRLSCPGRYPPLFSSRAFSLKNTREWGRWDERTRCFSLKKWLALQSFRAESLFPSRSSRRREREVPAAKLAGSFTPTVVLVPQQIYSNSFWPSLCRDMEN